MLRQLFYEKRESNQNDISILVILLGLFMFSTSCASTTGNTAAFAEATSQESSNEIKTYNEVITSEANTDSGLVLVHQVDEKYYYEIPDSILEKELLLVSRIAKTQTDAGFGGQKVHTHVVRWQRQQQMLLLRIVTYENMATATEPIYRAVQNSNFEPIVASFPIKAFNSDSTASVIDVTSLFTTDHPFLGLQSDTREQYQISGLDDSRTFVNWVNSYPRNVEVRQTLTYTAKNPPSSQPTNTLSLEMHHSMIRLPDQPMQPRYHDNRVGYFSVERTEFSAAVHQAKPRRYITRWRLEPSDPDAFASGELVNPVQPIVYYIDPATPEKWRPYIKQGVEDWQTAFEAAGFKNAILAKDPPSPEDDPEFHPEDVRYSVIRYFASDVLNAMGPHVHDPRTGEILESDIYWHHNVMQLLRNWYLLQSGAANPEARQVQLDDAVMGQLIRFVSAHEVGHTLGLPHNWGSSAAFPVDSLRSPSFTSTHGTAPSIMDYARFNYIAQPGDGVTQFLPKIGTYDRWAIRWGYRPIPDAQSADEERPVLNEWIQAHADDPLYFYGRQTLDPADPRSLSEDLGNDAVQAGELGIANLQRIVPELVNWSYQSGEDFTELEALYEWLLRQWAYYMHHAVANVGSVYETFRTYDQDKPVYTPVSRIRQQRHLQFLLDSGFQTPTWLVEEEILVRIGHFGIAEQIRALQMTYLRRLLDPQRLTRLVESELLHPDEAYPPAEMLSDLRHGLWQEITQAQTIDPIRRNLQRGYIAQMDTLMTREFSPPSEEQREYMIFTDVTISQSDIRAYVRGELQALDQEIDRALPGIEDRTTRLHLEDIQVRIEEILDSEE